KTNTKGILNLVQVTSKFYKPFWENQNFHLFREFWVQRIQRNPEELNDYLKLKDPGQEKFRSRLLTFLRDPIYKNSLRLHFSRDNELLQKLPVWEVFHSKATHFISKDLKRKASYINQQAALILNAENDPKPLDLAGIAWSDTSDPRILKRITKQKQAD